MAQVTEMGFIQTDRRKEEELPSTIKRVFKTNLVFTSMIIVSLNDVVDDTKYFSKMITDLYFGLYKTK